LRLDPKSAFGDRSDRIELFIYVGGNWIDLAAAAVNPDRVEKARDANSASGRENCRPPPPALTT
jgi:hypothetical protein